jgi:hypothetical protein
MQSSSLGKTRETRRNRPSVAAGGGSSAAIGDGGSAATGSGGSAVNRTSNISPSDYIHISGIPLTIPVTASIPREATASMNKTSLHTGKPMGFWYARGNAWATKANELYPDRKLYQYELPAELFAVKGKEYTVSATTMPTVNEEFTSWLSQKYPSIVSTLLYKIIEERDPDESAALYDLFSLYSNAVPEYDEDEPDDFYMWVQRKGAKILAANFPALEELPEPFNTKSSYAVAWSFFWSNVFAKKHPYVYFDASVLSLQDEYPHATWIKYLDIPSGCIFDAAKFFRAGKQPRLL